MSRSEVRTRRGDSTEIGPAPFNFISEIGAAGWLLPLDVTGSVTECLRAFKAVPTYSQFEPTLVITSAMVSSTHRRPSQVCRFGPQRALKGVWLDCGNLQVLRYEDRVA